MAYSRNRVELIGNLGADPETRSFSNGGEVVNLRVATSESWKDKDGNWQERTEWHSVAVFNEHLAKRAKDLRKGAKVFVEGQLQTRKWTDQSGADRYTTEIVLQKFKGDFGSLDRNESPASGGGYGTGAGSPSPSRATDVGGYPDGSDVPFITNDPRMEGRVS